MVDLISMGHVAIGVWPEHQIQTIFLAIHISLSTHTKKPLTFACNTVNSGCNGFAVLDLIKLIKINAKYEFLFKSMYNVSSDLQLLNKSM